MSLKRRLDQIEAAQPSATYVVLSDPAEPREAAWRRTHPDKPFSGSAVFISTGVPRATEAPR